MTAHEARAKRFDDELRDWSQGNVSRDAGPDFKHIADLSSPHSPASVAAEKGGDSTSLLQPCSASGIRSGLLLHCTRNIDDYRRIILARFFSQANGGQQRIHYRFRGIRVRLHDLGNGGFLKRL